MQTERRFMDVRLCIDGILTAAPETPVVGKQYLVGGNATGTFEGKDNYIAYYSAKGWKYTAPSVGQLEVFNLADLKFYRYEATGWVAYDVASSRFADPVINMVLADEEANLPATCAAGDVFIATDTGKVFTASAENTWGTGEVAVVGSRYASKGANGKVYTSTGSAFTGVTLGDTVCFVCKADDNIYGYDEDSTTFRNLTSIEDNPIYRKHTETIVHTLTAGEVTAKEFVLPKLAELECGVLLSVGGVVQASAIDFTVTNNAQGTVSTVGWDALGLDDVGLVEGDVFVVSFSTIH